MNNYLRAIIFLGIIMIACTSKKKNSVATDEIQQYVFIRRITKTAESVSLNVDYVQYFTGDSAAIEAKKAGEADSFRTEDGVIHYTALNDYFIVNENLNIRTFRVAENCEYDLILWLDRVDSIKGNSLTSLEKIYKDNLFRLTISNDQIVKVQEVFIP